MTNQLVQQKIQEKQYIYPYHYIPMWDGGSFSQTQSLQYGYEYMSYVFFILNLVCDIQFSFLLDLGCGDGRLLVEMEKKMTGKELVGMD